MRKRIKKGHLPYVEGALNFMVFHPQWKYETIFAWF